MEDAAVPYAWDSAEKTAENYINIPFFKDLSIAAGTGSAAGDEGHNGRVIPYAKSTLKANNVPDDSAFFVPVRGRSMEPDIPDGSTVGFNKAATRIIDGEVYAVEYGGLFRVKVLYEATNNRITLHSYNEEEYPDETLPGDEVTIIGQLFSVQKVYRTG